MILFLLVVQNYATCYWYFCCQNMMILWLPSVSQVMQDYFWFMSQLADLSSSQLCSSWRLVFRLGPVFGGSGPGSRWPHSRCCVGLEAGLGDVGGPTRPKFQEVRANQSITSESDSLIKLVECRLLVVSLHNNHDRTHLSACVSGPSLLWPFFRPSIRGCTSSQHMMASMSSQERRKG